MKAEAELAGPAAPALTAKRAARRSRLWAAGWTSLRRSPGVMVALALLAVVALMAAAPQLLTGQDPTLIHLRDRLLPPGRVSMTGLVYQMGTDHLGRDILTRLIYGARISLLVGITTALIGGTLGSLLGLLGGYYGGRLDDIIMRVADIQLAFPAILLYIAVLAVLGPGLEKVIAILGITSWVTYARVVRGEVLSLREREYVLSARAIGCRDRRIMARYILPNTVAPLLVIASFAVATAITTEASLSFLGLGVPASVPTWGTMLSDAKEYLRDAWWPASFPGLAIMFTVLAINMIGDWLRDVLDPQLKP